MTHTVPQDAASIILVRQRTNREWEFFWARRSAKMAFMAGYQAFPGGRLDAEDKDIDVLNATDPTHAATVAGAARELLEEAAVVIARGAETLSHTERRRAQTALMQNELTFAEFLRHHHLQLDAHSFFPAGRWVTPTFALRRFNTSFFVAELPVGQEPELWTDELEAGQWTTPEAALETWENAELVIAPPTLHVIRSLAGWSGSAAGRTRDWAMLTHQMVSVPEARGHLTTAMEIYPGIECIPLRTPTLPPATHTNCYVLGTTELIIIDPASPDEDEQTALDTYLEKRQARGARIREIWLTHHHPDHIGGVCHAQKRWNIPVAAHHVTADLLHGMVSVSRFLNDDETVELEGAPRRRLKALFTPGHAPGHLCFLEETSGCLITGDMVVGIGSVLINPPEGTMSHYLASLEKLARLPHKMILGGHGPALTHSHHHIAAYIAHRLDREANIFRALEAGPQTASEIARTVYSDTPPALMPLAERSVLAHLEKLEAENRVHHDEAGRYTRK